MVSFEDFNQPVGRLMALAQGVALQVAGRQPPLKGTGPAMGTDSCLRGQDKGLDRW